MGESRFLTLLLLPFYRYVTIFRCPRCGEVGSYPGHPDAIGKRFGSMRCQSCGAAMEVFRITDNLKAFVFFAAVLVSVYGIILLRRHAPQPAYYIGLWVLSVLALALYVAKRPSWGRALVGIACLSALGGAIYQDLRYLQLVARHPLAALTAVAAAITLLIFWPRRVRATPVASLAEAFSQLDRLECGTCGGTEHKLGNASVRLSGALSYAIVRLLGTIPKILILEASVTCSRCGKEQQIEFDVARCPEVVYASGLAEACVRLLTRWMDATKEP